jgi:LytS/YehU family sensor histidine kinase
MENEINYLATYLQLEQMRSESWFEYRIQIDDAVSPVAVSIPVMVLQPFVENAVRHGMQGVTGRTGCINIHFSRDDRDLVCRVEDNGIGRMQAALKKNTASGVYQSRGMQLTQERIDLLNAHSTRKITVEVIDKIDEDKKSGGTEVIIRFPIFTVKDNTLS